MNDLTQKPKKSMGCCGCLLYLFGGILLTVALAAGGGYYTLMHTPFPLRKIAEAIEKTSSPEKGIVIKDITGSFSSGARVKAIRWENGEIENLCITYDNLLTSIRSKRFIFREISVTKAHISVLEQSSATQTPKASQQELTDTPLNWELFQIDKLALYDVFLTNRLTGFSIAIPKFEWTGFKWEKGQTEFGVIKADTDAFKIETGKATIPGFVTRLTGMLRPRLHPSILKEFDFAAEIGPIGSNTPCRVTAFDGALTADLRGDGTGALRVHALDLSAYLKDLPLTDVHLDMEVQKQDTEYPLHLKKGSFCLGKTRLTVIPALAEPLEKDKDAVSFLEATGEAEGRKIHYLMNVKKGSGTFHQQLTSDPALSPSELVSLVFYGKPMADLTSAERSAAEKIQTSMTF